MQAFLADEIGAQSRKIAFGNSGETVKKLACDNGVEDRVAEKLKPLVMRRTVATMSKCCPQQGCIREGMAERLLESTGHSAYS